MRESKSYLGLELAGAKNLKTSLAALEFYPKEKKIFLLDIYDRISAHDSQTGDEALLDLIGELQPGLAKMAINVPLELPPCIPCSRKSCPLPAECSVPSVTWMREATQEALDLELKDRKVLTFTPYTQRPIELWIRYFVLPQLPPEIAFEIDETLGGNRAPLTARMNFLKRHLQEVPLCEVWPKLSVALLGQKLGIDRTALARYRTLEEGIHFREVILHHLAQAKEIFIYDRDLRKLAQSLPAFDAFICALTALLADQNQCVKMPKGFSAKSGWIQYPAL